MSITQTALMQQRRDTAANWTSANPTLLAGEIGIESDTNKIKLGTGSTSWTSLGYAPWSQVSAYPFVNADIAAAAGIVDTKLATIATAGKVSNSATTATSANTASAIVARDASGNFTAGTITAALIGNASTVTTNANLTGDVTSVGNATSIAAGVIVNADINASAAIVDTKLATIATGGKVSNSATTATNANTASAIVARDASGNFTAGTITAALTGAASSNVLKAGDTMTGALVHPLGAAATPSLTFTGDLNTGIFSPGADQLAVSTGGVQRINIEADGDINIDGGGVFYDATNNRLAIGTTSPSVTLDVSTAGAATSIRINQPDTSGTNTLRPGLFFDKAGTNLFAITCDGGASATGITYYEAKTSTGQHIFFTNSTERARIDSSGRLLVGTSSSSRNPLLQVAGALGLASAAMRTYAGTGDLTINLSSLAVLDGNNWKQCGGVIIYSGIEPGISGETNLVCYFRVQGLSTYSSVAVTNIVGTTTLTLSSAATSSCTLTLDVGNSVVGSALVFLTSTGGGGLS